MSGRSAFLCSSQVIKKFVNLEDSDSHGFCNVQSSGRAEDIVVKSILPLPVYRLIVLTPIMRS
jgi:hypothetical protein